MIVEAVKDDADEGLRWLTLADAIFEFCAGCPTEKDIEWHGKPAKGYTLDPSVKWSELQREILRRAEAGEFRLRGRAENVRGAVLEIPLNEIRGITPVTLDFVNRRGTFAAMRSSAGAIYLDIEVARANETVQLGNDADPADAIDPMALQWDRVHASGSFNAVVECLTAAEQEYRATLTPRTGRPNAAYNVFVLSRARHKAGNTESIPSVEIGKIITMYENARFGSITDKTVRNKLKEFSRDGWAVYSGQSDARPLRQGDG